MATFIGGNGAKIDASTTTVGVSGVTVAAGDLVVGVTKWEVGTSTISVSNGTTGATLDTLGVLAHANGDLFGCMWYYLACQETGNLTFTSTLGTARAFKQTAYGVFRYTGTASRNAGNQNAGTGTAVASGLFSPSGSELVTIGYWGNYVTETPTNHLINGVADDAVFGNTDGTQGWYRLLSSGFTNGQATVDQSGSLAFLGFGVAFAIAAAGGRTTKNTRSAPLGVEIGMNWRG